MTDAEMIADLKTRLAVTEDALSYGSTRWPTEEDLGYVQSLLDDLVSDLEDIPRGIVTLDEALLRHRRRSAA